MTEHIFSSMRRIGTIAMVTYFILPMLPGVAFSGSMFSAIGFSVMLFAAALCDMILISLAMWWVSLVSLGNFAFDFKMESKNAFAPCFVSALALAELQSTVHKVGFLTFNGWLPMAVSAMLLGLAVWAVCVMFDTLLFDLNVDRQGSRPRGGKRIRIVVPNR